MTTNAQKCVIRTSILPLALAALTLACAPETARRVGFGTYPGEGVLGIYFVGPSRVELHRHTIKEVQVRRVAGDPPTGVVKAEPGLPPPGTEWLTRTVDERGITSTTGYRVLEEFTYEGRQAYRIEVGGWCCSIYEKATGRLIAESKEYVTGPLRSLLDTIHWPIWVGKAWSGTVNYGETPRVEKAPDGSLRRLSGTRAFTTSVDAYEDVNVPAGTFKAFRIQMRWDDRRTATLYWYAPEIQLFVKAGDKTELIEFRPPK